jgi:hypothetical protein
MQTHFAYVWHLLYLHRRKITFLTFLGIQVSLLAPEAWAQKKLSQETYDKSKPKKEINLPLYDEKKIHYGFFLGLNYSRLEITHAQKFIQDTAVNSITPLGLPGFTLGFLLNVRLADQLAFKIVPSVGFYERDLLYNFKNKNRMDTLQEVETTFLEMQFLLKYRSQRRKNTRMYLIGGIKPAIRAGGKKNDPNEPKFILRSFDISLEYGGGLELYFPYFKWSPELRFSHGLVNLNSNVSNGINDYIRSALAHTVSIYFFFE